MTARLLIALPIVVLLAGCISLPKNGGPLTNHIVTTIDDSRCMTASRWWLVAITNDVNESECRVLLEALRSRQLLQALQEGRESSATSK